MALFESYERRINQINAALNSYGISSIEEAEKMKGVCKMDYILSEAHIKLLKVLVTIWIVIITIPCTVNEFFVHFSRCLFSSSFAYL